MEENQNNTDFLKETIKQRPLNKRKLVRRTLITAAMAVIFGMVACFTFLLLEPVISNRLYPEEEPEAIVFEEETEENEILPEDMIADESQMQPEETEPPALEDEQIAQVLSEMQLGTNDYLTLFNEMNKVAKEVQKSIVTVVGVTSDVTWLDNEYENEGVVSGVVVADNGKELLILANIRSIKDAEILKVAFSDGSEYEAEMKDLNLVYFEANKDNFISSAALSQMLFDFAPAELDSLISTLDSSVRSNDIVTRIQKAVTAQLETAEGKMFTDFEVNGVKFSSYVGNGKYMLVDFWASWCGPCKAEIPNVKKVWEKYAGKDFDVLSVAVWDEKQASIDTAAAYGVKWNQIVDAQSLPTEIYGIQGIPHIILFGPDGTILKRDLREEKIEAEVAKYVSAK